MGMLEFALGLGKSKGHKMMLFVFKRTQNHIANMIRYSKMYWNAYQNHSNRRSEIEDKTGAAFISHFLICLKCNADEKFDSAYFDMACNMSRNLRTLIEECIGSFSIEQSEDAITKSRTECASWLRFAMLSFLFGSFDLRDNDEFISAFIDECHSIEAEVVLFKRKFLQ